MKTLITAAIAAALVLLGAASSRAWTPWFTLTTPCSDAPQAVAIGSGRIAVVCPGDSRVHYKDFPGGE